MPTEIIVGLIWFAGLITQIFRYLKGANGERTSAKDRIK